MKLKFTGTMIAASRCVAALAALAAVACSPMSEESVGVAIGPEGGSIESTTGDYKAGAVKCGLRFGQGALNSTVEFSGKAYDDPLQMPRDTAPRFPLEMVPHLRGGGCFFSPTRPPYRDVDERALLRVPFAPGSEFLDFDERDNYEPLLVAYRSDPFGQWEPVDLARGWDRFDEGFWTTEVLSRSLGYFALVDALRLVPSLPRTTTVDEGAPIPLAFGLDGLVASTADIEVSCFYIISFTDTRGSESELFDCSVARTTDPQLRYVGEASWQPRFSDPLRRRLDVFVVARPRELPAALQAILDERYPQGLSARTRTRLEVVSSAPRIDTMPADVTVNEGQTAAFSVAAGGTRPLGYQWQRNGVDIPGATGTSYTTPPTTAADNGAQFRVVVTNARGTATTAAATLTVVVATAAPQITRGPLPVAVSAGQAASFDVVATGAAPLAYQWLRDGNPITGATASSYTLPVTTLADDGALFSVRVSNAVNPAGVTSTPARLTVTAAAVGRGAGDIVSLRPDGSLGGADSSFQEQYAVSRDGRYVAFVSSAPLAGGTACGLFLRDMQARTTQLLSLRPDGTPSEVGAGSSCLDGRLTMTPDGRYIAFVGTRTDLVGRSFGPGVVNRVYVRDTCIGAAGGCTPRTTLVSVDDDDAALTTGSDYPSISDDGRYVAFLGRAPNQTAFTNAAVIHDRDADGNGVYDERPAVPNPASPTFRSFAVSRRTDGTLFQGAFSPMISGNGRFVIFVGQVSNAADCANTGQNTSLCAYVYDRDANSNGVFDEVLVSGGVRTINVSVSTAGAVAQGGNIVEPWISADGRVVTYRSRATNLGATSPSTDTIYAHDRDVSGSGFFDTPGNVVTVVASRDAAGAEATTTSFAQTPGRGSRLGRFLLTTANTNLAAPNDPGGFRHLFLRDLCIGAAAPAGCTPTTVRISVRSNGDLPATALSPVAFLGALSADGRRVVFSQSGGGLVDLNGDGQPDEHGSREVYYGGTGTGEP